MLAVKRVTEDNGSGESRAKMGRYTVGGSSGSRDKPRDELAQDVDATSETISAKGERHECENVAHEDHEQVESERDTIELEPDYKEQVEEARAARVPADPGRPTKKEVDEHNASHIPYRPWCPHCVKGKAVSDPHKSKRTDRDDMKDTGVVTVSLDYCWAEDEEEETMEGGAEQAEEEVDMPRNKNGPILIVYMHPLEVLYALPVRRKGPVPWVVRYLVKRLESMGYGGGLVTMKSDGEPGIKGLAEAVALGRKAPTATN